MTFFLFMRRTILLTFVRLFLFRTFRFFIYSPYVRFAIEIPCVNFVLLCSRGIDKYCSLLKSAVCTCVFSSPCVYCLCASVQRFYLVRLPSFIVIVSLRLVEKYMCDRLIYALCIHVAIFPFCFALCNFCNSRSNENMFSWNIVISSLIFSFLSFVCTFNRCRLLCQHLFVVTFVILTVFRHFEIQNCNLVSN